MSRGVRLWPPLAFALVCGGCGGERASKGNDTASVADSGAPDVDPACDGLPVVTWANFGAGFMLQQCQSCHADTAADRRGAPEGVGFGEEADVRAHHDRIVARALGEAPTMPPEGGVSEDDRALLAIWLDCDPAIQPGDD